MNMIRKLGLAALLLVSAQAATAASINNMGFESGISPWLGTGTVATDGRAFEGNSYGLLVGDQSFVQTISLVAGQTYDFMWRFIAGDELPNNDFAFVVADMGQQVLATVASVANTGDSGWQYFSWVPTTTITGALVFGVVNVNGNTGAGGNSQLLLDATVPLPGAALLFGSALLGAGVLRRRKLAAAKKHDMVAV